MRVLVTSALPYANGPLHFGHIAGAYLPADIYVRTRRARGHDVLFLCGTDEHGVAVTLSARQAGVTPRQQVDRWHREIKGVFDRLDIRFDHFSRTATPRHAALTQEFFTHLLGAGWIEPREAEQLWCPKDAMFLPDRYVVGLCPNCGFPGARGDECPRCGAWIDPLQLTAAACRLCGSRPERRTTRHWYLLLDRLQPRLQEYIDGRSHWKKNVLQFVHGLLRAGLQPRPITRDLDWGVPVPLPEAAGKVIYVWFDAPIGYVTATQEWAEAQGDPERWRRYWQDGATQLVHFIGKDNIPFHCLTFPAMLMGQGGAWKVADDVPANEFFNLEGDKFNTSSGWYIDLDEFFSRYTPDMARWAIARNLPETADAEFTWLDFQAKVNGELNDIYGNFAHRVLTFVHNHFQGAVPPRPRPGKGDDEIEAARRAAPERVAELVESFRIRDAAVEMMNLARAGNRYFDTAAPWTTRRTDLERCGTSLNRCVTVLETLAVISAPFLPDTARRLWAQLGCRGTLADVPWGEAAADHDPALRRLGEVSTLFRKIDDSAIAAETAALHARAARRKESDMSDTTTPGDPASAAPVPVTPPSTAPDTGAVAAPPPIRPTIGIEDFLKCDFRLGKILAAEKVAGSKRLLKFTIDIGLEQRTILAGIQENYAPDELIGRTVVVIANLAPRKMMGIESQGMVLAAQIDGRLTVLTPLTEGLRPGAQLS